MRMLSANRETSQIEHRSTNSLWLWNQVESEQRRDLLSEITNLKTMLKNRFDLLIPNKKKSTFIVKINKYQCLPRNLEWIKAFKYKTWPRNLRDRKELNLGSNRLELLTMLQVVSHNYPLMWFQETLSITSKKNFFQHGMPIWFQTITGLYF